MISKAAQGLRVTVGGSVMTVQGGTVANKAPRFYNESAFWHALKQHLNEHFVIRSKKCDLVKRVMSKDGHMVGGDNYPYYLRDRKWDYCIQDTQYAVRLLHEEFNRDGYVTLAITPLGPDYRPKRSVTR